MRNVTIFSRHPGYVIRGLLYLIFIKILILNNKETLETKRGILNIDSATKDEIQNYEAAAMHKLYQVLQDYQEKKSSS